MERNIFQDLIRWKQDPHRKPLILKGARQTGKTWLMLEFGKRYYRDFAYFNFDEDPGLFSIFETNKDPFRLIELLGLLTGKKIRPQETLIIFDEIQECSSALNALKYFKERAPEYHIISAGSLLGALLAKPKSYPVGMVNLLELYPMYFDEFLAAIDPMLFQYYAGIEKDTTIEQIFHQKLLEAYQYYLIIGGMPEAINTWLTTKDYQKISQVQKDLLAVYENDFAKHNGKINSGRLLLVFRSIVSQLAKSNEKFIYGSLRPGARAREFEEAIEWLVSAGMVNRICNVSKPEQPLAAFEQLAHFKLFLFDTALLKQMAGLDNSFLLLNSAYQFKGQLTENYVLQQLTGQFPVRPRYFHTKQGEIDFLLPHNELIIPLEVKAGEQKSAASFKNYIKHRQPPIAVRLSQMGYQRSGQIWNIPLYLLPKLHRLLPAADS